jgi:hypothetical protein
MARIALVTGGARGIGAETCRVLARDGLRVAVADINHKGVLDVVGVLAGSGHAAFAVDVAQEAAVQQLFDAAESALGSIGVAGDGSRWSIRPPGRTAALDRHDARQLDSHRSAQWPRHIPVCACIPAPARTQSGCGRTHRDHRVARRLAHGFPAPACGRHAAGPPAVLPDKAGTGACGSRHSPLASKTRAGGDSQNAAAHAPAPATARAVPDHPAGATDIASSSAHIL